VNHAASIDARDASLAIATHVMKLDEKIDKVAEHSVEILAWQHGHQAVHDRLHLDTRFERATQEAKNG
jgi:hypothetical protein